MGNSYSQDQGFETDAPRIVQALVTNDIRPYLSEKDCCKGLYQLITTCWDRKPDRRPSFKQIHESFKSGEIYYPNSDMSVVMKHITTSLEEDAKDIIEIKEFLDRCETDDPSIEEFVSIASKEPIPNDYAQSCWEILINSKCTDQSLLAPAYTIFLRTSKAMHRSGCAQWTAGRFRASSWCRRSAACRHDRREPRCRSVQERNGRGGSHLGVQAGARAARNGASGEIKHKDRVGRRYGKMHARNDRTERRALDLLNRKASKFDYTFLLLIN